MREVVLETSNKKRCDECSDGKGGEVRVQSRPESRNGWRRMTDRTGDVAPGPYGALRIGVYEEHPQSSRVPLHRESHRRRGLPAAALLPHQRNDCHDERLKPDTGRRLQ